MNITKIDAVTPEIKKLKVAAYCRVSTDNSDQLESLDAQKKHYESWIRKHFDWEYAGLYYDSGISGTKTDQRIGLQNMLADCKSGKIEYILTKSISRFARNTIDCLEIVRNLKNMNIFVYFEKENIDTGSMDSELILSVLSSLAADESVSISENEKWSVKKRFQNGTYKLSYMPYGYTKGENGEMVIDKTEADVIRMIFNLAVNGNSTHAIAKILRENHVPTRKGGVWSTTTVRDMIANEKYVGDALFQKTYTDSNFRRHDTKDTESQYYIKDHHEPIISREIFETANKLIQQRAAEKGVIKGTDKYQVRYALSGKIVCGECGGTFKRRKHINEIAWACTTHINDIQKCSMKYICDDFIKAAVTTMMNKLIFARKLIIVPYLSALKESNVNIAEIQKLKAELQKESEKVDMLRMLYAEKMINNTAFMQDFNASRKRSEDIRKNISMLSNADSRTAAITAETEKLLKFLDNSEMYNEFNDTLLTEFIEKIIVYSRHIIGIQLKCGLTLKEVI